MIMALQIFTDLLALIWQHPVLSCLVLVLFTPPFFPIVKYFSPLLISTGLFMLALYFMGPKRSSTEAEGGEDWEFRRTADVKVWEDKSSMFDRDDDERMSKRRKSDGNWMDWVKNMEESSLAWVEKKLKNDDWKGSILNDENVSILQEAFSDLKSGPSSSSTVPENSSPSEEKSSSLVNQESVGRDLPFVAAPLPREDELRDVKVPEKDQNMELGEDAPELKDVEDSGGVTADPSAVSEHVADEAVNHVAHPDMDHLLIPKMSFGEISEPSPETDLDDTSDFDKSKRVLAATLRKNSMNANSGLSVTSESDVDAPAAVKLSKSGKLKAIESLGDFIEELEHSDPNKKTPVLGALKPSVADNVQDVQDKLESFVSEEHKESPAHVEHMEEKSPPKAQEKTASTSAEKPVIKPGSSLFKDKGAGKKTAKKSAGFSSDDESSSGEEELSDSDSDSEFEIFPPHQPPKMKLHPPVKLDIQQLEKRLGNLQQRQRRATSPEGEITEIHQESTGGKA